MGIGNLLNGYGPLIKNTAMPIYGKTLKIFSRTKKAFRFNLGIKHRDLRSTKFVQI